MLRQLGQLALLGAGVALGVRAVDAALGPRSLKHEVKPAQPAPAPAFAPPPAPHAPDCELELRMLSKCLDMGGSEDYCRAPRERLRECEARRGYS